MDVVGLLAFALVVAGLGWALHGVHAADLEVYHLAAGHIGPDDVYEHLYPRWPFTYPPSGLLMMAWLAAPMEVARWAMYLISVGAVWITLHLTARAAAPGTLWSRPGAVSLFATLTMVSVPVVLGSALGQVAPIVMGLAAIGTLGRRSSASGAWVGTAAALKLTPAVFAVFWWLIGRRRDAVIAALTFGAWTGLGALVMPDSSAHYYLGGGIASTDEVYAEGGLNASNQSLTSVAARFGLDSAGQRLLVIVASAVLLIAALFIAKRIHEAGWTAVSVALVGVWSGVAAPVAFIHAFGWWVPLAVAIALTGRTVVDALVALAVYVIPLGVMVQPWEFTPGSVVEGILASNYAILAVAVTLWLCWRVSRLGSAGHAQQETSVGTVGTGRAQQS